MHRENMDHYLRLVKNNPEISKIAKENVSSLVKKTEILLDFSLNK